MLKLFKTWPYYLSVSPLLYTLSVYICCSCLSLYIVLYTISVYAHCLFLSFLVHCLFLYIVFSCTLYPFMHTVCSCPFLYIVLVQYIRLCALFVLVRSCTSVLVHYIRLCTLFVLVRSCTLSLYNISVYAHCLFLSVLVHYIRLCTLYVLVRSWHCPYLYFLCFWTLLRFWCIIYKSILSLLTIHLIPHTLLCFEITEKAKCIRLLTDVYVDGGWALRFGWEKKPSNTPFKKIHLFHLQFDLTGDGGTFPLPPPL